MQTYIEESRSYAGPTLGGPGVILAWQAQNRFDRTEPSRGIAAIVCLHRVMRLGDKFFNLCFPAFYEPNEGTG
jgi:hypothetical protein